MRHYRPDDVDVESARFDRGLLRRTWQFVRPYRVALVAYLVVIAITSVLGIVPPIIFKRLIDHAIPSHDLASVDRLAVAAVGLALLTTALSLVNRWFGSKIGEGLIYDLRVALYRHVQSMPVSFFTRTQTGSLLSRLSNDVVGAQATVGTLASVVSDMFQLTSTLLAMVYFSWQITALALLVLPVYVVVDKVMAGRLKRLARRRMTLNGDMTTTMQERFNVSGALLVKLFGRPEAEASKFGAQAAEVRDTGIVQALAGRVLFAVLALVGAVGTAAVYWFGARAVIRGSLTLGEVVALAALVQRLYSPLTDLAGVRVDLLTALVSFERCFELLDAPRSIEERPDAIVLPPAGGHVVARDVWFRYPGAAASSVASLEGPHSAADDGPGAWVLRGVSFDARPGTMTALVGLSGAGKTTLSHLVPRLYDVVRGSVSVDGHDVRDLTLASLADAVGMVTQDAHLFHDTIAENLRYARPDASDAALVEACRAARIHDLIDSLPDGYATVVGERGYRLSGGEKQRLALARVLLKDPAVVILDEATAHLDSETESLVQQALASALAGRTSIVIAHRLSTIQAADQILVVDDGRIAERGTHDELLSQGGTYAELYATQYLRGGPPAPDATVATPMG